MSEKLLDLLQVLEEAKIHYSLIKHHADCITVEAVVPGERWEIQVFENGTIQGESFKSGGDIVDEAEVRQWIKKFTD